jgi:exodeoxyribonuclease VII large subunit
LRNNIDHILSVSELTKAIKFTLEETFEKITVQGEISNFKSHTSGHWYFNLKDEGAVINCTMWKGLNNYVFFTPQDGIKINVTGRITVYPPRGNYQLDVRSMKPAGEGELQAAFERLKQKLFSEGLFEAEHKKEIPAFPKKIGLITAIDGAAFKDMVSVAERRFPLVQLIVAPAKVQGSGAAENIAEKIRKLNLYKDIDVIILARGGGSIEDLWAFNEEIVARAIFKSKIPIISGVGHEVDFTIADFVADLRAPTPSVAMELATPDMDEIKNFIEEFNFSSYKNINRNLFESKSEIHSILSSYAFRYPLDGIRKNSQMLDQFNFRIIKEIEKKVLLTERRLSLITPKIEAYDINKTLKRGFALIKQNSKIVSRKKNYNVGIPSTVKFYDGEIEVK